MVDGDEALRHGRVDQLAAFQRREAEAGGEPLDGQPARVPRPAFQTADRSYAQPGPVRELLLGEPGLVPEMGEPSPERVTPILRRHGGLPGRSAADFPTSTSQYRRLSLVIKFRRGVRSLCGLFVAFRWDIAVHVCVTRPRARVGHPWIRSPHR